MATDQVHFIVGREDFYIEKNTLLNGISKYFSAMFSGNVKESQCDEPIYIDADPIYFRRVLNTIRYGKSSEYIPAEVAEHFGININNDSISYDVNEIGKIDKTDEVHIHEEITRLLSDMDPAYKQTERPNIIGHQQIANNLMLDNSHAGRVFQRYYNNSMIFGKELSNIELDKNRTTDGDVYSHNLSLYHENCYDIFIKFIVNDNALTPINIMQAIRLIRIIVSGSRAILSEFTPSSLMVKWNILPKIYRNFAEVCIQTHNLFPIIIPHPIINQRQLYMHTKTYIVVDPAIITDVQIIYNSYENRISETETPEAIIIQTYRSQTTVCDVHNERLLSAKLNSNLIVFGFYVFVTAEDHTTISANNITLSYNGTTSTHDCLRLIATDIYIGNTPIFNIYCIKDSTILNLNRILYSPNIEIMFAESLNGRYTIHVVYDSVNILTNMVYLYSNDSTRVQNYIDLV